MRMISVLGPLGLLVVHELAASHAIVKVNLIVSFLALFEALLPLRVEKASAEARILLLDGLQDES